MPGKNHLQIHRSLRSRLFPGESMEVIFHPSLSAIKSVLDVVHVLRSRFATLKVEKLLFIS